MAMFALGAFAGLFAAGPGLRVWAARGQTRADKRKRHASR
jgi:hypothetical protein